MQIRNINWPAEREAIAEHIRLVHGPGDSDLLMRWYGNFPGFDPADCFVIEGEGGEIAAHTMIIPRAIRIGPASIPTAEIGVVGTLETYRGRGYARALMDRALGRMSERRDALGMILGIPNFYERWGFEYAFGLYLTSYESEISTEQALRAGKWDPSHSHHRRTAAYLGMRRQPVTVRRFYSSDLDAVMALYDAESAEGRYLIARDQPTWDWQLAFMTDIGRYEPDDFLVAEVEGAVAAYVRVVSRGQVNWFRENEAARFSVIESAGTDADATEALLAAVAQLAHDYGAERIGVFVHPQSQMMRHVLAHGGARRDFTGAGFLRLHDLPLLLELLKPALEDRLHRSPFAGRGCRLSVVTEHSEGAVELGDGAEEVILEAPAIDMVRLVTGWFGIDDLPQEYYVEQQRWLLRALFPKREPRIGMADIL